MLNTIFRTAIPPIIHSREEYFAFSFYQRTHFSTSYFRANFSLKTQKVPPRRVAPEQLLIPLCLAAQDVADLAIVVEDYGNMYRASTCLTLDQAMNNARLLARPDRDWLNP